MTAQLSLRLVPALRQKEKKKSIKLQILELLKDVSPQAIACHEFIQLYNIPVNDHSANTRINEMRRKGIKIKDRTRKNCNYKEYWIE